MKKELNIVRDYLIVAAATLTMTAIFASPLIGIYSKEVDNPRERTHRHITENQEAIGELVASAAQD